VLHKNAIFGIAGSVLKTRPRAGAGPKRQHVRMLSGSVANF